MSISSNGVNPYQYVNAQSSPSSPSIGANAGNSDFSVAIQQALADIKGGAGLLTDSQQPSSDFMNSLLAALPGSSSGQTAPANLDQASPSFQMQSTIQTLITQLNASGSADPGASSALADLQQSFDSLVSASNGNPSQESLQSFLKSVAANIQGSVSIGSLLDTSA